MYQPHRVNMVVFFFFSIAKAYPSLDDTPEFFDFVNDYLCKMGSYMVDRQIETCFDICKLNANMITDETKQKLVEFKMRIENFDDSD